MSHRVLALATFVVLLLPGAAVAQMFPIPNELSVGIGAFRDQTLSQVSPALLAGIAFDDEHSWAALVVEAGFGPYSDAAPCRLPRTDEDDTCVDATILGGLRFRRPPYSVAGTRPFGQILLGKYWKGSGSGRDDQEFASEHFVMEFGGGVEFRWPGSFQGARLSLDYLRVFAGNADRNELRFLGAYVIGPRRFKRAAD